MSKSIIYKHRLFDGCGVTRVKVTEDHHIMKVGIQDRRPQLWVSHKAGLAASCSLYLLDVPTGMVVDLEGYSYLDTLFTDDGLVHHIYWKLER